MRFPLTETVGYRLCKKGELGCPDCVSCATNEITQLYRRSLSIRVTRYCTTTKGQPSVAKDCRCDHFLKIRSGTESWA
jgi:hypothetical protein